MFHSEVQNFEEHVFSTSCRLSSYTPISHVVYTWLVSFFSSQTKIVAPETACNKQCVTVQSAEHTCFLKIWFSNDGKKKTCIRFLL